MLVAGVDGCPGGWAVVLRQLGPEGTKTLDVRRIVQLTALTTQFGALGAIAIDMPIGLPAFVPLCGRAPEALVRSRLGARQSSVFSIPSRAAIYAGVDPMVADADRFSRACAVARATSAGGKAVAKQAFHLFPKIVELDRLLRTQPALRPLFHESHPELVFRTMQGAPLDQPKKVKGVPYAPGLALRREILVAQGFESEILSADHARALRVGADDLLDAAALAWTAARIAGGNAVSYPAPPQRDEENLPIAIWA